MTATERSEQSDAGVAGRPRSEAAPNPWARGGAMSAGWHGTDATAEPAPSAWSGSPTAVADGTEPAEATVGLARDEPVRGTRVGRSDPPRRSPPTGLVVAVVMATIALVATIAIVRTDESTDVTADREPSADREVSLPRPSVRGDASVAATRAADLEDMPTEPVPTAIGQVAWTRVDGDRTSLPARVTDLGSIALIGDDSSANHWTSDDGGITWTRLGQASLTRSVGGVDWTVRDLAGERSLWLIDDRSGLRSVEIDSGIATSEVEGFAVRVAPTADGFPLALSGGLYLPVTVRAALPWHGLLDLHPTRAFRLEIDVDGRTVRVTSGDFHELDVERLVISEAAPARFEIRRPDGRSVGSFGAPPTGMSLADVVSGRSLTLWTRWTGDRFARADPPWDPHDRVDIAATTGTVLARVVSPDRTATLWRTIDGESWSTVELPLEQLDRESVTIDQLEGEVVVTAYTERGVVSLATTNGATWTELAPVPGVNRRDRADFGWIAPPTRSEPQIRVSADGVDWQLVDLRTMLGVEYSRWDVRITATAIGSDIFVIADHGDVRTLLIGSVSTS